MQPRAHVSCFAATPLLYCPETIVDRIFGWGPYDQNQIDKEDYAGRRGADDSTSTPTMSHPPPCGSNAPWPRFCRFILIIAEAWSKEVGSVRKHRCRSRSGWLGTQARQSVCNTINNSRHSGTTGRRTYRAALTQWSHSRRSSRWSRNLHWGDRASGRVQDQREKTLDETCSWKKQSSCTLRGKARPSCWRTRVHERVQPPKYWVFCLLIEILLATLATSHPSRAFPSFLQPNSFSSTVHNDSTKISCCSSHQALSSDVKIKILHKG